MTRRLWLLRPIVVAVSSCFGVASSWANPTGPQVVHGNVQLQGLGTNHLKVTNSPGSIINWQGFSIGAGQITQFTQQSAASAVLNRVVGADISQIHGQLLSNGRVFLINPAGIVIGGGATIDTAGFVGSTLNMLDADFLAGKLRFQGDAGAGSIVNRGLIKATAGGNIVLIAPQVENGEQGVLHTDGGQLVLAAGKKLTVGSLDHEGVQFEIQAPSDSVLNVGRLLSEGGAIGVFAGTLKHSGDIRAGAIARDASGRVVLKAQSDVTLSASSTTIASGERGGEVWIQSGSGQTRISGEIEAAGRVGKGGDVTVLGDRVSLTGALIDASGARGGGHIRVGGDYQGANAAVPNAARTFVGAGARLKADSTDFGDGGRIIVWSDKDTQFYGSLSARGGATGGNGGFAEVSGKDNLIFAGTADLGAPKGAAGDLLLDPLYLFVDSRGGSIATILDELGDVPSNAVTVSPTTLSGINGNVTLFASRYMRINNAIALSGGRSLTATVATHEPTEPAGTAPNRLEIGADITTDGGGVTLTAPRIQSVANSTISTAGGAITLTATGNTIEASQLTLNAGAGAVNASSANSFVRLGAITGGDVNLSASGALITNAVTASGLVNLTSQNSFITVNGALTTAGENVTASSASSTNINNVTTGGGTVTINTNFGSIRPGNVDTRTPGGAGGTVNLTSQQSDVSPNSVMAGNAPVTFTGASVSAGTIDTTNAVGLTATAGSVSATVNNASGVTASASTSSSFSSASVNIGSATALKVDSATATSTGCFSFFGCPGAFVSLFATGDVTVGTVSASARTSGNNSLNESINITSNTGSILRAASGAHQIRAADVALATQAGTGGGVGTAAAALNVDAKRTLNFSANGAFNLAVNGTAGPNRLFASLGRARTGETYSGTVTGGGIALSAAGTDTTVTVSNLTISETTGGFKTVVNNTQPQIFLNAPNSSLIVQSMTVPEGGTAATGGAALPVFIVASNDLRIDSYTRQTTADSLAKTTQFTSGGNMTLGQIAGGLDNVTASAGGNVSIAASSVTTRGGVNVFSSGNITVGRIDNSAGTGSVTLSASGDVLALNDSAALEIQAGSGVSISGRVIGTAGFTNPLDLTSGAASTVTLTTNSDTGRIGFAGAPVVANTSQLTINANTATPSFSVSTGTNPLKDLIVTMRHTGSGDVTSDGKSYTFTPAGAAINVTPDPNANQQFADGRFRFTATTGNIDLASTNVGGSGSLEIFATSGIGGGSITTGALDGRQITLNAGSNGTTGEHGNAGILTGLIGGTVRPAQLTVTAGRFGGDCFFCTSRTGSFETSGTVLADVVDVTVRTTSASGNAIKIGPNGDHSIGSALSPAGTVTLKAERGGTSNFTTGSIRLGDLFAQSATLRSGNSVTTGALEAPTIVIGGPGNSASAPAVITGAIGAVRPLRSLSVDATSVNIAGAVTGDGAASNFLNINTSGRGGNLTVGGNIGGMGENSTLTLNSVAALAIGAVPNGTIAAGDGSRITLVNNVGPLQFASITAGAGGTVSINSPGGIQQNGGTGITAGVVSLTSTTGLMLQNGGDGLLDLNSVATLTLNSSGDVALDANNSRLANLTLTRGAVDSAFTLTNLNGQTVSLGDNGSGNIILQVSSPGGTVAERLNFTLDSTGGGITTTGAGVTTSGGSVNLSATGPIDASTGGITTGANDQGGSVSLIARSNSGTVSTGAINTAPSDPTIGGGAISVTTNCATCGIVVSGDLQTSLAGGAAGGGITLNASAGGSITNPGGFDIVSMSPSSVVVTTPNGNIGAGGAPLLVTTPTAVLTAGNPSAGNSATAGNVFATLTGTNNLNLTGESGFDVTSTVAFDTLAVATRGTASSGTTNLTAAGQPYGFARPANDLFGNAIANTFEVVNAAPGGVAPTSATFTAVDGDLLVRGGAALGSPNLTLRTLAGTGDLKLQGNTANPLTLTNTGTQTFIAGRHLQINNKATITGGDQTLSATNGDIQITGGGLANEAVLISAGKRQHVFTSNSTGGSIALTAGDGDASSVRLVFTGTDPSSGVEQQVEARGNLTLTGGGGTGTGSIAEITTAAQRQLVRADGDLVLTGGAGNNATARVANTGSGNQQVGETFFGQPYPTNNITVQGGTGSGSVAEIIGAGPQQIFSQFGTIAVLGGSGPNAFARIDSSSTAEQRVGHSQFCCGSETSFINVQGGSGTGAYARITAPNVGGGNQQRIHASTGITLTGGGTDAPAMITAAAQDVRRGSLTLTAGIANNANALIQSAGNQTIDPTTLILQHAPGGGPGATATAQILAGSTQRIFASSATMTGGAAPNAISRISTPGSQRFDFSSLTMTGGSGPGASVRVDAGTDQSSFGFGSLTMNGGSATDAFARMESGGSQQLSLNNLTLRGGSGANAHARITGAGTQTISGSTTQLTGGTQPNAFASIDSTGTQNLFVGNMTLTAGGTAAAPVANAGAVIEGNAQTIFAGAITLNGGAGTAGTGNVSDAVLRSRAAAQSITANQITMAGGAQHSTTGILNQGTGIQTINAFNGIAITGNAIGAGADVLIQNSPSAAQTLTAGGGGIVLNNTGTGLTSISSAGTQTLTSRFVDVTTSAGSSGNSTVSSTGNQWIHTTNGTGQEASLRVAALGTGVASVETNATQLLEIDFPEVMQSTPTVPGTILVGRSNAAGTSRVQAPDQLIFAGALTVQGGSGSNSTSAVTATNTQAISTVAGGVSVLGGSGSNATAKIDPTSQSVVSNGTIAVTGGSNAGAAASIVSSGSQTLIATKDDVMLQGGSAAGATARVEATGAQVVTAADEIKLTANTASALLQTLANQIISASNAMALTGGAVADAVARIRTADAQTVTFGSLDVTAGSGTRAHAQIDTTASQTLTGGNITVGGGGESSTALLQAGTSQAVTGAAIGLTGGTGGAATARMVAGASQTVNFASLAMNGGTGTGSFVSLEAGGAQTLTGSGNVTLTGNGSGSNALVQAGTTQAVTGAAIGLTGGSVGAATARMLAGASQNVNFTSLAMNAGTGPGSLVSLEAGGAQTLTGTGSVTLAGSGSGSNALVQAGSTQSLTGGAFSLTGGTGANAYARVTASSAQTLNFTSLTMTAGPVDGAFVGIDTSSTQSLNGAGNVTLTGMGTQAAPLANAGATIVGHSQTLNCGAACNLVITGGSGTGAGNSDGLLQNLSGAQSVTAGTLTLTGGHQFSRTGILNDGAGTQTVTLASGPTALSMTSAPDALSTASVVIQNSLAGGQTITAIGGETRLNSAGAGTVGITSGGTQSIDTVALDVLTAAGTAQNGAHASVTAANDQTIHTSGALAAAAGVGMRVTSRSTGTALVQSGTNQTLNIGHPELVPGALLLGSLSTTSPSAAANAAVGDSIVQATSTLSPNTANQTVQAASVLVQGPAGDSRTSKLSADATQAVTTFAGGISVLGGAGANSIATIDPTRQTITSFGDILLQGGSGRNADSLINATGPQIVRSRNGGVILQGGTGPGADALITTTSPTQTVQGRNGGAPVLTSGPLGGGIAGLVRGADSGAQTTAATNATGEVQREQNLLEDVLENAAIQDREEERRLRDRPQLCS